MHGSVSVLIVSGMRDHRDELAAVISSSGMLAVCCGNLESAQSLLGHHQFSMILCDGMMSGDLRTVVRQASCSGRHIPVVIVSGRDDWNHYLSILRAGAFDCVPFPTAPSDLVWVVHAALREFRQAVI
jgi:DNA-binding response OmpR family regulator